MRRFVLTIALLLVADAARGQQLPGTQGGDLPPQLRGAYEEPVVSPRRGARRVLRRPFFILVSDVDFEIGYSDNLFITADVLGGREVKDGMVSASPRLRGLFTLNPNVGLVADYQLEGQAFFHHGDSHLHSGKLFLGYRPVPDRHAEVGVTGAIARVSDFEQSNVNDGSVFLDGTWGWSGAVSIGAGASIGAREFPDRTIEQSEDLFLGLLPLPLFPSGGTSNERQEDTTANGVARLMARYGATGAVRLSYDVTNVDSNIGSADRVEHQVAIGASNVWTRWLATVVAYSAEFRRFDERQPDADPLGRREDTIHDVALSVAFYPGFLRRIPLTRSASVVLRYDALFVRSNVEASELERNFLSASISIGFRPLTTTQIARALGGR